MEKRIFTKIIAYILPYKKHFIIGSFFAFAFSIANGITLYSVVPIFDTLSPGNDRFQITLNKEEIQVLHKDNFEEIDQKAIYIKAKFKTSINNRLKEIDKFTLLIYICSILFIIILFRIILKLLSVYYIGYAGYGAIKDIRQSLYHSIIGLPISFFHRQKTGELISNIIYDTDMISDSLSNQLRKFVINVFVVITHIALLLYINIELTLYAFFMLLIITIPILLMGRAFKEYSKIEQQKMSDIASIVLETINGIKIIKSYQMEDFQIGRFFRNAKALFSQKIKKAAIDFGRPQLIEIISSLFLVFLFIYGGKKTLSGEYTKGEFLFFVFTFLFIMNPIKQISNMNNLIKQAEAAGVKLFNIIEMEKEIEKPIAVTDFSALDKGRIYQNNGDIVVPKDNIRFDNVNFRYPLSKEYVLKNIDFTVEAGKKTAIVGRSGVGKTTLVDLIPRFFEPTQGVVLFDGVDISSIPLQKVRNSIGVVTQEVFLFNGTIAENIAYGRKDIPIEDIINSAKIANAHDFIMKIPNQYDSVVGERGVMLSGGERQRIAIARSILRNPPILILDEATSSLDTESEKLVQEALNRVMQSRSSFVIAHRLSTIVNSDLILVLDDSQIAEAGIHTELLEKNGIYKKLHDIQFSANI